LVTNLLYKDLFTLFNNKLVTEMLYKLHTTIHGAQARENLGNALPCTEEAMSLAGEGGANSVAGKR
jgi:hypothetical protein